MNVLILTAIEKVSLATEIVCVGMGSPHRILLIASWLLRQNKSLGSKKPCCEQGIIDCVRGLQ